MQNIADFKYSHKRYIEGKVILYAGLLLLFLMLAAPRAFQELKLVILFLLAGSVFITFCLTQRVFLHTSIAFLFIFYIVLGGIYGVYGYFRGNLGAAEVTKEIVYYPFFYLLLVPCCKNYHTMKRIHQTFLFSACFIAVYFIATILHPLGMWPDWLYFNMFAGIESFQSIDQDKFATFGIFEIEVVSAPSLMFLQPYLICYQLINKQNFSVILIIAVLLCTLVMILSGIRILFLVAMLSSIIFTVAYCIKYFRGTVSPNTKRSFILLFVFILSLYGVLYSQGVNFQLYYQNFLNAFAAVPPQLQYNQRYVQIQSLFYSWQERPIFGFGSGAVDWSYIRSSVQPWKYEVTYIKNLYDFGLFGCFLYGMGLFYIFSTMLKIYKEKNELNKYALPMAAGSIGFLIGCGSNPYLHRFDSLFVIFLPVALINIWLLNKKQRRRLSF